MAEIGKINELRIIKEVDFGVYLDGEDLGEILLPQKYISSNLKTDDLVKVFIYFDSEDRIIATTQTPYAQINEFAFLEVVDVTSVGAFLDWGLEKDLFVPYREQKQKMVRGKSYLVRIYLDERSDRIAASTKIDKFLGLPPEDLIENQKVDLLISHQTELGFKAIVDKSYQGMIFENDLFRPLKIGQAMQGYIKKIRPDGKIDLSIQQLGYEKVDAFAQKILNILKDNKGYIAVSDKSKPELIYHLFGMSKKSFKMSIGALYKQKLIIIDKTGIRLTNQ